MKGDSPPWQKCRNMRQLVTLCAHKEALSMNVAIQLATVLFPLLFSLQPHPWDGAPPPHWGWPFPPQCSFYGKTHRYVKRCVYHVFPNQVNWQWDWPSFQPRQWVLSSLRCWAAQWAQLWVRHLLNTVVYRVLGCRFCAFTSSSFTSFSVSNGSNRISSIMKPRDIGPEHWLWAQYCQHSSSVPKARLWKEAMLVVTVLFRKYSDTSNVTWLQKPPNSDLSWLQDQHIFTHPLGEFSKDSCLKDKLLNNVSKNEPRLLMQPSEPRCLYTGLIRAACHRWLAHSITL